MEGDLTPLPTTIPPSSLKEPSFFGRKRVLDETPETKRLLTSPTILRIYRNISATTSYSIKKKSLRYSYRQLPS